MEIQLFRDIVICVLGVIAIAVLIMIAILSFLFYQKSKALIEAMHAVSVRSNSILDAIENTTANIQGISSSITRAMLSPVAQIIATIQGIRQGINIVNILFKKKETEEKENE
jgi:hypothetical protein